MRQLNCLTYCRFPYNAHGPTQTCVSILENFVDSDARATFFVPRKTRSIGKSVDVIETLPLPFRWLPWRMVSDLGYSSLNRRFLKTIQAADPKQSIAYFWPDPPASLVTAARDRGLLTVREMINSFRGNAKSILDKAYAAQGLMPTHGITDESVERERQELALYDYVFASNAEVEVSLIAAGIKPERIIRSSFGWTPSRYASTASLPKSALTLLFVGSVSVRKGAPQLIEAWKRSGVAGELVFAGKVEPALAPLLARQADPSIRYLDFVSDMGAL
jgi:hypothetical protein